MQSYWKVRNCKPNNCRLLPVQLSSICPSVPLSPTQPVQLSNCPSCPPVPLPDWLPGWLLSRWLRLSPRPSPFAVLQLLCRFVGVVAVRWRWSVWRLKVYLAAAFECVGVAVAIVAAVVAAAKMKYECKQTAQLPQECRGHSQYNEDPNTLTTEEKLIDLWRVSTHFNTTTTAVSLKKAFNKLNLNIF